MKKALILSASVLLCLFSGFVASRFQAEALLSWYPLLNKSPLTPPNGVFPVVWSLLYIGMGLSIGLIISANGPRKLFFTALFAIQLALNFTWSIVFFYNKNPSLAFIVIIMLLVVILYYAIKAYAPYRASFLLFAPYILWVSFAAYLNLYIALNNEGASFVN